MNEKHATNRKPTTTDRQPDGPPPQDLGSAGRKDTPNGDCIVITYDGGQITEQSMTHDQARKLDPNDVDLHEDRVHGQIYIKQRDGTSLHYFPCIPGDGDVTFAIRRELMARPGVLMPIRRLEYLANIRSRDTKGAVAARLARIRRAFGDNGDPDSQHYFRTRRQKYAICWDGDRIYRIIRSRDNDDTVQEPDA